MTKVSEPSKPSDQVDDLAAALAALTAAPGPHETFIDDIAAQKKAVVLLLIRAIEAAK